MMRNINAVMCVSERVKVLDLTVQRTAAFYLSPFHPVTVSVLVQKPYLANIFLSGFTQSLSVQASTSWENRLHFRHVYDYESGN